MVDLYENRLKHVKIQNGRFTRTIGLLKHRYSYETTISKAFIEHCHDYFRQKTAQKED
ncbi:hypothetical protein [Caryophanon tenue]|uniref:hypothetical protein n=1 Tax=Caryophanon tenue TaxID=33978 RepID=UPI0014710F50|nr:hypothetical protein [Caryophanon tenue]